MNDHFSIQAEVYAKYRPKYPNELYEFIFQHLKKKHLAWDCATGSGQVATYLAKHFDKVYASDISEQQLSYALKTGNVEYFQVPAEDTGFPSGIFDLITVAQAVHWFDIDGFYQEVHRTAGVGALLALIGYGFVQVNQRIDPVIDRFYQEMFGSYFSESRSLVEQRYQTIPFPFDEIPSPMFETVLEWKAEDLEGYFNTWSSVQRFKTEKGVNPVIDVMDEVKRLWSDPDIKKVSFPVFLRLGRVE